MEKRLYDAAVNNDVPTLFQLLQQDSSLLDRTNLNCKDKNPLHIAVMLGHVGFVRELLPFSASYYMCFARDRDGRNPLHLAAMYGKMEILQMLVRVVFQAALDKADGGGTILHLCVKFNHLDALKFLAGVLKDPQFLNAKNEDGLTILHLAVYYYHKQITLFLLENTEVGVNVKSAGGKTALDFLLAQGNADEDILGSLVSAEAMMGKDVRSPVDWNTRQREWYEKSREAIMVVASLIATMAFQAGLSPPGGVWQDDSVEGERFHRVGEAVMAQKHPAYYGHLLKANTMAFVSALSTIILLIRGSGIPSKYLVPLLGTMMCLSITTIAITYAISLATLEPSETRHHMSMATEIVIIVLMVGSGWMVTFAYELFAQGKKSLSLKSFMNVGYEQY